MLAELSKRDELIADEIREIREIFVKGTKSEDFDKLEAATKAFGKVTHENRAAYAELVKKHVNLPIAERTRISAYGELSGDATDHERDNAAHGVLSVGYG